MSKNIAAQSPSHVVKTLQLRELGISLGGRMVVQRANCTLGSGEMIGVVGPKQCGKTTLLAAMCRRLPREHGSICIDGRDIECSSENDVTTTFAFLPQQRLLPGDMTVMQAVSQGRIPRVSSLEQMQINDWDVVERCMQFAEVDRFADRQVRSLSSGENIRASLARALALEAPILLADEPAPDPGHASHIMDLLREISREGKLVVVALDDPALAEKFCDRVFVMQHGTLACRDRSQLLGLGD